MAAWTKQATGSGTAGSLAFSCSQGGPLFELSRALEQAKSDRGEKASILPSGQGCFFSAEEAQKIVSKQVATSRV